MNDLRKRFPIGAVVESYGPEPILGIVTGHVADKAITCVWENGMISAVFNAKKVSDTSAYVSDEALERHAYTKYALKNFKNCKKGFEEFIDTDYQSAEMMYQLLGPLGFGFYTNDQEMAIRSMRKAEHYATV